MPARAYALLGKYPAHGREGDGSGKFRNLVRQAPAHGREGDGIQPMTNKTSSPRVRGRRYDLLPVLQDVFLQPTGARASDSRADD